MMKHLEFVVVLFIVLLDPSLATVTITVTNDAVLSGETATLTCTVTADNGETLSVQRWKDTSGNVIGNTAGSVTKDGVDYTISDLGTSGNQILNWKIEVTSVSADMDSLNCWVLADNPYEENGIVDVVTVTSTRNGIVSWGTAAVSCTLGGVSGGGNPTVEWSQNGNPINSGGSYSLTTDYSGSDKIAVLSVSGVDSDQTYTCKFTANVGGSVTSTVDLDHVTITATNAVISSGDSVNLNCILAGGSQVPVAKKWFDGTSTEITVNDGNPYVFYSTGVTSEGQNFILSVATVTQTTTYTCCYQFVAGSCIETNAQVDIMTLTASNYLVKVGSNSDISCVVTNAPNQPSTITWKTTAGTINSGFTHTNYADNSQTTTLSITSIAADTVYTCDFVIPTSNSFATVSKTITVDTVTLTPTSGTALSGGSVTVSCQIVGAALQPTVTWKDGVSTVNSGFSNDPWALQTGTFLSKLTVSGLTSTKSYTCEFTVNGKVITETAVANILSIAPIGATTDTGSAATVTCIITNSPAVPTNVFWKDSSGDTVVLSNGFSKSENSFNGGTQEAKLVLGTSTIHSDTYYVCVFVVEGTAYEATVSVDHIPIYNIATRPRSASVTLAIAVGINIMIVLGQH